MKLNLLAAFLALSASYGIAACATPATYSAEPIEAWIVNADTKQPVEGAVVVARWVLEGGIHVDRVGDLVVLEAVTDENGRFYFSAWGPIRHWKRSRLTNMDPEILVFKSGYEYRRLVNPATKEAIEGKAYPVRRSQWNGKTIELRPFEGTLKEYAEHLSFMSTALESIFEEKCGWKKIPRMILAVNGQSEIFRKQQLYVLPSIASLDSRYRDSSERTCGSVKEFFKAYAP